MAGLPLILVQGVTRRDTVGLSANREIGRLGDISRSVGEKGG